MTRQQATRPLLRGEPIEDLRRRPDEGQAVVADGLREILVLGQKPVAGMDGIAARDQGCRDERRRREVAAPGVGGADADSLIGDLGGETLTVGLAVCHDRSQPERPAGSQDPQGDLAAVGDEDARDHAEPSVAPASGPALGGSSAGAGRLAGAGRRAGAGRLAGPAGLVEPA